MATIAFVVDGHPLAHRLARPTVSSRSKQQKHLQEIRELTCALAFAWSFGVDFCPTDEMNAIQQGSLNVRWTFVGSTYKKPNNFKCYIEWIEKRKRNDRLAVSVCFCSLLFLARIANRSKRKREQHNGLCCVLCVCVWVESGVDQVLCPPSRLCSNPIFHSDSYGNAIHARTR